ncbi:MAG: helix-hairpin-helix domain-containing protein [Cellulophaga sp.]
MDNLKSHFRFNKQERSGIFFLLAIIIVLQLGYYFYKIQEGEVENNFFVSQEDQKEIDSLKSLSFKKDNIKLYSFNPNFITDYRGYVLGMSVKEIDALHAFRKTGKFVNSSKEFQKVTGVSDSLLQIIELQFKFPEWTKKKVVQKVNSKSKKRVNQVVVKIVFQNINTATAEDFKKIYGIGNKLSARIVKFRERLGGFLVEEQLYDVYGLEDEVVKRTLLKFAIITKPKIQKININTATVGEIAKLIYIRFDVALAIVKYREVVKHISSFEELNNLEGFPSDKIDRIQLYLSLQ